MPILSQADINARNVDPGVKQLWLDKVAASNAITALAGGGQTAPALTNAVNRVTTVATAADSVRLPPAVVGTYPIVVVNAAAANSMNIFPSTGDAINALSANTAIACAANKTMIFFCAAPGIWNSILTA